MGGLIMFRAAVDNGFISALALAGFVYCVHVAFS